MIWYTFWVPHHKNPLFQIFPLSRVPRSIPPIPCHPWTHLGRCGCNCWGLSWPSLSSMCPSLHVFFAAENGWAGRIGGLPNISHISLSGAGSTDHFQPLKLSRKTLFDHSCRRKTWTTNISNVYCIKKIFEAATIANTDSCHGNPTNLLVHENARHQRLK